MRTARRGSLQLRAAGGRALGFGRETSPARARRGSTGSMDGGDGAPVWYIDEVNSDEADSSPDAPWNALEQDSDGSSTLWDDESFDDYSPETNMPGHSDFAAAVSPPAVSGGGEGGSGSDSPDSTRWPGGEPPPKRQRAPAAAAPAVRPAADPSRLQSRRGPSLEFSEAYTLLTDPTKTCNGRRLDNMRGSDVQNQIFKETKAVRRLPGTDVWKITGGPKGGATAPNADGTWVRRAYGVVTLKNERGEQTGKVNYHQYTLHQSDPRGSESGAAAAVTAATPGAARIKRPPAEEDRASAATFSTFSSGASAGSGGDGTGDTGSRDYSRVKIFHLMPLQMSVSADSDATAAAANAPTAVGPVDTCVTAVAAPVVQMQTQTSEGTGNDGDTSHSELFRGMVRIEKPQTQSTWLRFDDENGLPAGSIEANGQGGIRLQSSDAGDFAEWYPRLELESTFEEGDVVALCPAPEGSRWHTSHLTRVTKGATMLGVISRKPIVAGSAPSATEDYAEGDIVAFTGRVPVKVVGRAKFG